MRYVVTTDTPTQPVAIDSDKPPHIVHGFVELGGSYFRPERVVSIVKATSG